MTADTFTKVHSMLKEGDVIIVTTKNGVETTGLYNTGWPAENYIRIFVGSEDIDYSTMPRTYITSITIVKQNKTYI